MKTLEEILKAENESRTEEGMFGLNECKHSIKMQQKYRKCSLYTLLEEYVKRANEDMFFNRAMVLACWELINER